MASYRTSQAGAGRPPPEKRVEEALGLRLAVRCRWSTRRKTAVIAPLQGGPQLTAPNCSILEPALREKPGGRPASPERNRHTRLTMPVLWHPLGIDCRPLLTVAHR